MRTSHIKNDILKELCSGELVSGGVIAAKLGVSRTAVWKEVNALRAEGYFITGLGGGYLLSPNNTRLCGEQLRYATGENVIFFDRTISTNEDIKAVAESAPEFTVAVARGQTGGKGRMGRRFFSPEGGLYFSVLLKPRLSAETCLKITTAAAVCMAKAIEKVCGKAAKIKWVNDIYIGQKKVCGILTEGVFDAENGHIKYAVLGVGVNVATPKGGFAPEIRATAGALFDTASPPSLIYCALISEFMRGFKGCYGDIAAMPHLEEYRRRSMLEGRTVTYIRGGKSRTATVCGIGDKAELIVKEKGKTVRLKSGEVNIEKYE